MNITIEQKIKAAEIAKKFKVKAVFVNNKGEFFTAETYAKNSVNSNPDAYKKVDEPTDKELKEFKKQKELAEKEAKQIAEKEAKEKAEKEAKELAEKKAKEDALEEQKKEDDKKTEGENSLNS